MEDGMKSRYAGWKTMRWRKHERRKRTESRMPRSTEALELTWVGIARVCGEKLRVEAGVVDRWSNKGWSKSREREWQASTLHARRG